MSKFQYGTLVVIGIILIVLVLAAILPPVAWAILVLVIVAYGLCWLAEEAIRKAWRRR